jgi:acetyltransferase-like isoleucine patch superfamily enzyme
LTTWRVCEPNWTSAARSLRSVTTGRAAGWPARSTRWGSIGDSVILNTGCIIDHQTMIGEGSHICPGVRIAGRVKVEPGVFVGIGATVIPKVTLGCEAIIGAGAVVIEDVLPLATVVGVPARPIKLASATEDVAAMLLPARP